MRFGMAAQMRSAGFADDGVGLQNNVADREIPVLEALEHGDDGHGTDVGTVLMLRG